MKTLFGKNLKALKQLLVFRPPDGSSPFVLPEAEHKEDSAGKAAKDFDRATAQHTAMLQYARRVTAALEKVQTILKGSCRAKELAILKLELEALEEQKKELSPLVKTYSLENNPLDEHISTSLEVNRMALQRIYNLPDNKDLILRSIVIPATPPVTANLAFIDGLVNNQTISLSVLQPLMLLGKEERELYRDNLIQQLVTKYLPSNQVKLAQTMRDVTDSLNLGDTVIFFDGVAEAVLVETKGQEHRGVDRPATEQTVRGSQSAFSDTLRVNTGLVRSILRSSNLTTELFTLGVRSNTPCALMYLKSVINPLLVKEMKRRLDGINVDTVSDAGALQSLLGDHPIVPYPQSLSTERPDRVAAALAEGRLALLLDGSSFAIVAPISLFSLFHAAEDFAFSWIAGSFARMLRLLGALLTVSLPALYIAIVYYHQEALPTDMILAIGAARERVPIPSFVEILMMEFAFELLREGGVRIPGMLGSTIGIVGAIILGQAAVTASIVSPITVVIIAVTGLASFTIPDYSLATAIRLTRFIFEVLAALLGLVGVAGGLVLTTVLLCSMKSLGVPYLAPIGPKTKAGYDVVIRGPVFSQEMRPDELNTQDQRRQSSVSRLWKYKKPAGKEKGE
ncbi:spore germination protein [Acetonema longum]|uniref:GerA spore germination protein n=1 Tax=Acetonema longum DSM 6540 TaxID=1009370 RepID=F7NHY8_9FIRM|nr:spore germination protein [Acetonema longum]EGO64367.1 GerA spore germination protein [Acetonema longum DSM 6540]